MSERVEIVVRTVREKPRLSYRAVDGIIPGVDTEMMYDVIDTANDRLDDLDGHENRTVAAAVVYDDGTFDLEMDA